MFPSNPSRDGALTACAVERSDGRGVPAAPQEIMSRAAPPAALNAETAERLQRAYAAHRRAWAKAVGRPYRRDEDPRPPPGEIEPVPGEPLDG